MLDEEISGNVNNDLISPSKNESIVERSVDDNISILLSTLIAGVSNVIIVDNVVSEAAINLSASRQKVVSNKNVEQILKFHDFNASTI